MTAVLICAVLVVVGGAGILAILLSRLIGDLAEDAGQGIPDKLNEDPTLWQVCDH